MACLSRDDTPFIIATFSPASFADITITHTIFHAALPPMTILSDRWMMLFFFIELPPAAIDAAERRAAAPPRTPPE